MEIGVGVHKVVHSNDLDVVVILTKGGAEDLTANTAETVDDNSDFLHDVLSFYLHDAGILKLKYSTYALADGQPPRRAPSHSATTFEKSQEEITGYCK
jgi:hypothetical protein